MQSNQYLCLNLETYSRENFFQLLGPVTQNHISFGIPYYL